jgi:hypothetical protein
MGSAVGSAAFTPSHATAAPVDLLLTLLFLLL